MPELVFEEPLMSEAEGAEFWVHGRGAWAGSMKTYMEPGTPVLESTIRGTLEIVPGCGVMRHEYTTRTGKAAGSGSAVIGKDIETLKMGAAWFDSFHTAGGMMLFRSDGREEPGGISVRGSYAAGDTFWHWRMTFAMERGHLRIRHYNILPDGTEAIAVDIDYVRDHSGSKPAAKKPRKVARPARKAAKPARKPAKSVKAKAARRPAAKPVKKASSRKARRTRR